MRKTPHKPLPPNDADPQELEPGTLPDELVEGLVPAAIPDDPEHDRMVDPED